MSVASHPVTQAPQHPRVGVGVIILREGLVLLGRRIGSHGAGSWALPGGHLEFGETVEQCAAREVREETGLELRAFNAAPYTNDIFASEQKHYVTLFVVSASQEGEPAVLEPDKCLGWHWFRWSELPRPLFQPLQTLVGTGYAPGECGLTLVRAEPTRQARSDHPPGHTMDHQLVIKFWRKSLEDEGFLTKIEDELKQTLGSSAELDGYDVSAKEINLFILTADPRHTFRRAKSVLESLGIQHGVSAASRLVGGAKFTSLWPLRATRKFTLP